MSHESVAEQVLAEVQAQTAPEAPTPEAAPDAELAAMQAAMDADGAEVEVEETTPGEAPRKRGLSWEQAVKSVPPDIAQLMRSMHADYTRKTQELSSQRKDFVREREALMRGKKALTTREELPEYDPFNEDSIKARIEQEVTLRLQQVLEPMQAEYEQMAAQDNYKAFVAEHPDFERDTGLRSARCSTCLRATTRSTLRRPTGQHEASAQSSMQPRRARHEAPSVGQLKRQRSRAQEHRGEGGSGGKPQRGDLRKASAADILAMAQAMHRR